MLSAQESTRREMRLHLLLMAILTISISMTVVVLLPSLNSGVNAIVVNNTDFSVNVLDNWAYTQSSNPLADMYGIVSTITIIPSEFSHLLVNESDLSFESIRNGGANSIIALDSEYPFRNVPVERYAEYNINIANQNKAKILSKENATIDGEKAIKIHYSLSSPFDNIKLIQYYTVHDENAYLLDYEANVKDFQKYLPQFEQMVKTFKFAK
jgi:PsbP